MNSFRFIYCCLCSKTIDTIIIDSKWIKLERKSFKLNRERALFYLKIGRVEMTKLVQCIPNFSEGRNGVVINALKQIAEEASGVTVLDVTSDEDHNRMSIAMLGSPEKIANVAFSLVVYASENIDMTKHEGAHPRMGATDVVPFVPVKNMDMNECIELSKAF